MNEISKLIDAYNRLWNNVEMMRQDIINILVNDFGMEYFTDGGLNDNVIYSSYFKGKMIIHIIIDLSAEIPFLQIFKINVFDTKKDITKEYMKTHEYKGWDPNTLFSDVSVEKKEKNKDFTLLKTKKLECIPSPKIDILSINSTDTVNSEIKNLLSNMKNDKYIILPLKEIRIIE
jgi:hypothetical protein